MALPALAAALPWVQTGLSALPFIGSMFGGGQDNTADMAGQYADLLRRVPALQEQLTLQTAQARRNDPLHAALVQMSMNLLPRSAMSAYEGRPSATDSELYMGRTDAPNRPREGREPQGRAVPRYAPRSR